MSEMTMERRTEVQARRSATQQGLRLSKSRREHWGGPYFVSNLHTNGLVTSEQGMNLDEVVDYLREDS